MKNRRFPSGDNEGNRSKTLLLMLLPTLIASPQDPSDCRVTDGESTVNS
jgi:hypothetical protein